jgi:hypothetical protein
MLDRPRRFRPDPTSPEGDRETRRGEGVAILALLLTRLF